MSPRSRTAVHVLLIGALGAASVLPLARGFLAPYVTSADNNTATFAQPARNYLRHGLLETRLGLTWTTGDGPPRFAFNTHHPPLQSLAAAGIFAATGVSDWGARVYPALCSVASSLLLFIIWRRHRGAAPAACAALMMAALPGFGHFGKMLGEEAPTLMLGLLAIALYQRWKDSSRPGGAWTWALPYAAGCLSGWAAFHVGPLLMADAAVTLGGQAAKRRRALWVTAATGIACFLLILAHVAVLTGSIEVLMDAARNRTIGPEQDAAMPAGEGPRVWLQREAGYFRRLCGSHGLLLVAGGLLAGAVALWRRRVTRSGAMAAAMLAGFGVAHPLLFPEAARYHDWLLFHLLPIVGLMGAEGLFLLGGLAAQGLRLARSPATIARAAGALLILAGLAAHHVVSIPQAGRLQKETTGYAWPLLGREIGRLTAGDAHIMANFPFRDAPLRFYADRPSSTVTSIEAFDQLLPLRPYELYVRDLNVPIAPALERRLQQGPCLEMAAFTLCALVSGSPVAAAISSEAAASRPREWAGASLEAEFGPTLRLTGYEWSPLRARPDPRGWLQEFLGVADQSFLLQRIIRVKSRWTLLEDPGSAWRISTVMTEEPPGGAVSRLPDAGLPSRLPRSVPPPGAGEDFTIEKAFVLPEEVEGGRHIRLRWAVTEGGRPVQPVMPAQPHRQLKVVVSEPIPLFAAPSVGGG